MMRLGRNVVVALVALLVLNVAGDALASSKNAKTKPRKDVLKKFGLTEDPGTEPDPAKVFLRNGVPYTIEKMHRVDTREPGEKGEGWIRHRHVQTQDLEIYQENEDFVWVWLRKHEPVERPRFAVDENGSQIQITNHPPEMIAAFKRLREGFVDVTPPQSDRVIEFKNSSAGLPTAGSWRNSASTGDMNGDGFIDIVLPPQRGPEGVPYIFLGDGKGGWRGWDATSFPRTTNYGSVSVADLNGDGHLDIAHAVHLRGPVVYLGDGKGNFTDASEGLSADFATRMLRIADLDRDSDLDLVVISEGPVQGGGTGAGGVKMKVFLNDGSGSKWTLVDVNEPDLTLGGDWLALGDLNGDGLPDIVSSSVYFGGQALFHLNAGGDKWTTIERAETPINSYYFAVSAGRFSEIGRDEAIMAFQRAWRWDVDPEQVPPPKSGRLSGIERVTVNKDGTITRTPIVQWLGTVQGLRAMGTGDFDADGNLDIAFIDTDLVELTVLLGNGKGEFRQAKVEGATLPDNLIYDLHVADLNDDGISDLVFLFEADENRKNGSVRVLLGRGARE